MFGNALDEEQFFDDVLRRATLERGVEAIVKRFPVLRVLNRNVTACSASVFGSAESIESLVDYVDTNKLGDVLVDSAKTPAVRAARR